MAAPSIFDLIDYANQNSRWPGRYAERFYSRCRATDAGCMVMQQGGDKDGYPMVSFRYHGKEYGRRASHVSLGLNGVQVPKGEQVNHHCDNRKCVNPRHLFVGTQDDNVKDMMEKGRHAHGDQHVISKLTSEAVKDIRRNCTARGAPKLFAAKYGVAISTIYAVKCGQNWRHIV